MRCFTLILISFLCFASCKSSKQPTIVTKKERSIVNAEAKLASAVIQNAQNFEGVRYKYGGTSRKGMDCSGLVVTAFKAEAIDLPRTTKDLASHGDWVDLKKVTEGDLLFFATKKNSRRINHVGLVTSISNESIEFIHSTTSKGVITSSLKESYWYLAFVQARRVL